MSKRRTSRTPGKPQGGERAPAGLNARTFPALSAFLKGYLHQDFAEEHGSVPAAVAAFCRDASPEERRRLETELSRLVDAAGSLPSRVVGRFVTRDLGSAWLPNSARELTDILHALKQHD